MQYDEEKNTKGLIAGSIGEARRYFKDGEPNDEEGEKVFVHWKQIDGKDLQTQGFLLEQPSVFSLVLTSL